MISIVIPLYNKERQIANTLRSVLAQSYQDFEIIVVDDGSTDCSVDIVNRLANRRIRLIQQPNSGVSAARNKGIENALGSHIAFLDADDEWHPDYLATQIELIYSYPDCDVFATNYSFCNAAGETRPTQIRNLPFDGDDGLLTNYFEVASTSHPPLWTSAVVVSKEAIMDIGGFPVGIKSGEDLLTWARLAARYKIAYCRKALATFVFDEKLFNEDQKNRTVSLSDEVGAGLKDLYAETKIRGLRQYIALWYKMRVRICLSKNMRMEAIRQTAKSMRYSINVKIAVFAAMCFLPHAVNHKLFSKLG